MSKLILISSVLVFLIGCANTETSTNDRESQNSTEAPSELRGIWTLEIENLQHQVITTMSIHFSKNQANSCLGGNWQKIVVESHNSSDEQFFPVAHPLSYELVKNHLVIGRNEVCDAYLHLSGELIDSKAKGEYVAFGWGSKQLGYFSLKRGSK